MSKLKTKPTRFVRKPPASAMNGTVAIADLPEGYDSADCYGLILEGDCMEPEVMDGSTVVVDPHRDAFEGEMAMLETVTGRRAIKRLVGLPPIELMRFVTGSEVVAWITVEQISPPKRFSITVDTLECIYPVIAVAPPGSKVAEVVVDLERPPRKRWEPRHMCTVNGITTEVVTGGAS